MRRVVRVYPVRSWVLGYATESKPAATSQQPTIPAYKPQPRISRHPTEPEDAAQPEITAQAEPKDPARGAAAMMRVVREGKLDDRYKPAARRITALICALPILIFTSYVLFQRRFMGVEQKKPIVKKAQEAEIMP